MKVDVERLIVFLMSDQVIINNIPESLELGLKEQGLMCKDGKIVEYKDEPTINNLVQDKINYVVQGAINEQAMKV